MNQIHAGRNNKGGNSTGSNQSAALRISDIKRNYNVTKWFSENTMAWYLAGSIPASEFEKGFDYQLQKGLITLKTGGTPVASGGYNRPTFKHDSDDYGYDYLYGLRDFQSDQDIWNRFSEDLTRHEEQEGRLSDAHAHRLSIEDKVDKAKAEHQKIWDSISTLHTKHTDQETRISQKAGIGHTHDDTKPCDCEFWDFGCKIKCGLGGLEWLKWLGLAIGIGLLLWLIRPLFKIGANLTK